MQKKFLLFLIIPIIIIPTIAFAFLFNPSDEPLSKIDTDLEKTQLDISSLFLIYGFENQFDIVDGKKIWKNVKFELNPENNELYDKLRYDPNENTIVVYPHFTSLAYDEPGFYTYYRGECDEKCLSLPFLKESSLNFFSSGNAYQVLSLLGYPSISDIDIDKNPSILNDFDKVILLHSEYVTKNEFTAITNHPKVIYLYPNALYAEVKLDYTKNLMTLHRGHNYPDSEIRNGFDWEFDNSPLEYNTNCVDMGFNKIDNGWMLNCYPERAIHQSKVMLQMIKEF